MRRKREEGLTLSVLRVALAFVLGSTRNHRLSNSVSLSLSTSTSLTRRICIGRRISLRPSSVPSLSPGLNLNSKLILDV